VKLDLGNKFFHVENLFHAKTLFTPKVMFGFRLLVTRSSLAGCKLLVCALCVNADCCRCIGEPHSVQYKVLLATRGKSGRHESSLALFINVAHSAGVSRASSPVARASSFARRVELFMI